MKLQPPKNLKNRLIKLKTDEGRWVSVRVKSKNKLKTFVRRYNASEVYYSVSCYQNPLRVENGTYAIDKKILWVDNIYDVDDDYGNLEKAWDVTQKIISVLGGPDEIHETGAKGYHLIYPPMFTYPETTGPIGQVKKKFIYDNDLSCDELDIPVSSDPYRVIRMVGSPNIKTGNICTNIHSPESYDPSGGAMTTRYKMTDNIVVNRSVCRPGVRHAAFYIALSNKIANDFFVPYLYFHKKPNKYLLHQLQVKYKLPDFYIFQTNNTYTVICLKPVSKDRLIKIMKAARSCMWRTFRKYKKGTFSQLWLRTSSEKTKDLVLNERPELVGIVKNKVNYLQSIPHYMYIKKYTNIQKMPFQVDTKVPNQFIFKKVIEKS